MKKFKAVSVLLLSLVVLTACGSGPDKDKNANDVKPAESTEQSESAKETDSNLLANDKIFGKIATGNGAEDSTIVDRKDYNVNWDNSTWSGVNYSADKVIILKIDGYKDYSDNEYQGFVLVHFNIDNTERDIITYPEQGTLVTNTGEQSEGNYELENWAGDVMKGAKKEGYASFPLKKLDDVNSIENIRLKFYGTYETDDYDDENYHHDYDFTIDLQ